MKSDNLIQISGYVTKDARINDTGTFASFSVAHRVNYDTSMYFNCVIFSRDKKIPSDILRKGKEVFIKGALRPNNYTIEGSTFNGFQIVVEKIRNANE